MVKIAITGTASTAATISPAPATRPPTPPGWDRGCRPRPRGRRAHRPRRCHARPRSGPTGHRCRDVADRRAVGRTERGVHRRGAKLATASGAATATVARISVAMGERSRIMTDIRMLRGARECHSPTTATAIVAVGRRSAVYPSHRCHSRWQTATARSPAPFPGSRGGAARDRPTPGRNRRPAA